MYNEWWLLERHRSRSFHTYYPWKHRNISVHNNTYVHGRRIARRCTLSRLSRRSGRMFVPYVEEGARIYNLNLACYLVPRCMSGVCIHVYMCTVTHATNLVRWKIENSLKLYVGRCTCNTRNIRIACAYASLHLPPNLLVDLATAFSHPWGTRSVI